MLEACEASSGALDLLDTEVQTFGRAVRRTGAVVVQDFLPPTLEGVTEGADLVDLVGATPDDGLVEQDGGLSVSSVR